MAASSIRNDAYLRERVRRDPLHFAFDGDKLVALLPIPPSQEAPRPQISFLTGGPQLQIANDPERMFRRRVLPRSSLFCTLSDGAQADNLSGGQFVILKLLGHLLYILKSSGSG